MMQAPPLPRLGKYELLGELGRGAMGVVYRAFDHVLQREVALKTMVAPNADQGLTERFLREARTAGSLHHPNIVTIHELGQESGTYFIAMELLQGQSLYEQIRSGQPPSIERRLEIVARACDGMDYAHRAGIVHRDIKPANVFLLANGSVKILDFGIAKISASEHTRTGLVMGTVDYMSPEQVRAVKNLDGRSDIFSAGVILYELLFRRRPFSADDMGAALHRILHEQPAGYALWDQVLGAELANVLRRSLDKRREARFARAGEMAEALDRAAASLRGRAGTELSERIGEVLSSGLLERADPELPPWDSAADGETREIGVGASPAPSPQRRPAPTSRRRPLLLLLGTLLLAVSAFAWLGLRPDPVGGERPVPPTGRPAKPEPPPAVDSTPAPAPAAPVEGTAPTSEPPTTGVLPKPAAGEPEVAEAEVVATPPAEPPPPAAPLPAGWLELAVMPWANVEWIENVETGERQPSEAIAPVRLKLSRGRYRLRLVNPYAGRPLELDVEVRGNATEVVRRTLPGFDPARLARDILTREKSKGSTP